MSLVLPKIFDDNIKLLKQNNSIKTYFDIYNINILSIDFNKVQSDYYTLSKKIHPDLFSNSTEEQQSLSQFYNELLNNGLKTFKNLFSTANYWLETIQLRNSKCNLVPKEIMGIVFEIQELLEIEALYEDDIEELDEYLDQLESREKNLKRLLSEDFEKWDSNVITMPNELAISLNDILNRYSYIRKLIEQINKKLNS